MNQISDAKTAESRWRWLYKVGAATALIILVLFLTGIIGIITVGLQSTTTNDWFTQLQNNWLVVLFKLNAGVSGVQTNSLNVINLLDIVIMALFCTMSLALYGALRHIGSFIAAVLPLLGIPIFLITSTAGRSTLLLGGLIISIIMLRGKGFSRLSSYVGIVASVLLLFAGDIATALFSSSNVIAVFIGIGYVLWMVWFFLIARRLYQLSKGI